MLLRSALLKLVWKTHTLITDLKLNLTCIYYFDKIKQIYFQKNIMTSGNMYSIELWKRQTTMVENAPANQRSLTSARYSNRVEYLAFLAVQYFYKP